MNVLGVLLGSHIIAIRLEQGKGQLNKKTSNKFNMNMQGKQSQNKITKS